MKIREHHGTLDESLCTVTEIEPTHAAVAAHVTRAWAPFEYPVTAEMVRVTRYVDDPRIGWRTHIIEVVGLGVFGFTDGPLRSDNG